MEEITVNKYKVLNKVHLQLIAILAMTIDHLTWLYFPGYSKNAIALILHVIGRLAFPIMAFFIAEGYHYTRNKEKYLTRLFVFSLISHVPYVLQSIQFNEYGWKCLIPFVTGNGVNRFLNQFSVLFAYFVGLLMLMVNDSKIKGIYKVLIILLLCLLSFPCDWSCIGSLVILSIGSNRGKPIKQILNSIFYISLYAIVYIFSLDLVYGLLQLLVIISIPVLYLYNGKKSSNDKVNKTMKWFFYIYYPLHLLIIGLLGL